MRGRVIIENNSGHTLQTIGCGEFLQVVLTNDHEHADLGWRMCLQRFTIPVGESSYRPH